MNEMPIDRAELQQLCDLARLNLPAEREAEVLAQLQRIVAAFAALREVDTTAVGSGERCGAEAAPQRADVASAALPRDEVLANAPQRAADCFVVPRVVDA